MNVLQRYWKLVSLSRFLSPVLYITGPDGAGKTSTSKIVSEVLADENIKYKHIYSMKRNLIRAMIFYIRRKIHGKTDPADNVFSSNPEKRTFRFILTEDIFDRNDDTLSWKIRKAVTLLLGIIDVFFNYIAVFYFRMRGFFVIVETSPYDLFIKYHMPEFKFIETVFSPLIPKPSLGLVLTADPQKIYDRRPELYVEELSDYYVRIDVLLRKANATKNYVAVRTDESLAATKKQIEIIVQDLM